MSSLQMRATFLLTVAAFSPAALGQSSVSGDLPVLPPIENRSDNRAEKDRVPIPGPGCSAPVRLMNEGVRPALNAAIREKVVRLYPVQLTSADLRLAQKAFGKSTFVPAAIETNDSVVVVPKLAVVRPRQKVSVRRASVEVSQAGTQVTIAGAEESSTAGAVRSALYTSGSSREDTRNAENESRPEELVYRPLPPAVAFRDPGPVTVSASFREALREQRLASSDNGGLTGSAQRLIPESAPTPDPATGLNTENALIATDDIADPNDEIESDNESKEPLEESDPTVDQESMPDLDILSPVSSIEFGQVNTPAIDSRMQVPENPARSLSRKHGTEFHFAPGLRPDGRVDRNTIPIQHKPLYFEDPNLERCGVAHGCFTEIVSVAHFAGRIPALPYLMGVNPPCTCVNANPDCPACHQFGTDAYFPNPGEVDTKAALIQGIATVGLVFLIP